MAKSEFAKPFDGAVTTYAKKGAPKAVREALDGAKKHDILDPRYPYDKRMKGKDYDAAFDECQLELIKAQKWIRETGQRVVLVFEGRDAAGKGGNISRVRENLNPRSARIVALPAPSEVEAGQWYFQRYIEHLPTTGDMILFDRSWYNRAVVEHVFGWCTEAERERFFLQVPQFEETLVREGIILIKFWISIGRAEQVRQFLERERDPLKQWKLSKVDIEGLKRWDDFTAAISEMFARTDNTVTPWTVVWGEDKRRGRIAVMRAVLEQLAYPDKKIPLPDRSICGGPEILAAR